MSAADIIVIALVALALFLAVRQMVKHRGEGCCGDCSSCGARCSERTSASERGAENGAENGADRRR